MRKLHAQLGRIAAIEEADDPVLARARRLGGEREARDLGNYKTYADGVVEIETEHPRADISILRQPRKQARAARSEVFGHRQLPAHPDLAASTTSRCSGFMVPNAPPEGAIREQSK